MNVVEFLKKRFGGVREQKIPEGNFVLSLDIGTEFVKTMVFEVMENCGKVIGVGRVRQGLSDMSGGVVTNIAGVIDNCRAAIHQASAMAGISPTQMVMGIGGELVKGATTVVNYERHDAEEQITLSELKNIVHKIQWQAFDQVRSQLAWETGYPEIDVKLVNADVVDVRVDGYRVINPLGFQGKNVTMAVFNAFAPLVHFGSLQTIAGELNVDLLSIIVEPYAISRSLQTEDEVTLNAIFMDIGGGTTDLAVVRNGGIDGTKMFALGGRTFTKRLAQVLSTSFDEAERVKLAYAYGKLDSKSKKVVAEAMMSDAEVWLSGVGLTLSEFYNVESLPANIYLCGGGSGLPEIKEVLETHKWWQELPFPRQPKIGFIQPADMARIVDKTGMLINPQDIAMMALANMALDLAGEEPVVRKVLQKVVRMMQN